MVYTEIALLSCEKLALTLIDAHYQSAEEETSLCQYQAALLSHLLSFLSKNGPL